METYVYVRKCRKKNKKRGVKVCGGGEPKGPKDEKTVISSFTSASSSIALQRDIKCNSPALIRNIVC